MREAFSYYLEGKNPIDREALYQKMVKGMTHQHADYVTMGLISAFDVAIWESWANTTNSSLQPAGRQSQRPS